MKEQTKRRFKLAGAILLLIVSAVLMIKLMPWFYSLRLPEVREEFKNYVASLGWKGVLLVLGIQVLQVVIAVLPGEPVELLAGMTFGIWGGLAVCMVGLLIGTIVIFYLVRLLGKGFVESIFSKKEVGRFSFLQNTKKLEVLTFLLFFIPGTPKDVLTYVAPLTKIRPINFFLIAILARIPSVITSTYAGQTFIDGEWWKTVGMFVLMGLIGIAGILINNSILDKHNGKGRPKK